MSKEIMAVTGHKSLAEVERYTDEVNQALLATAAIARQKAHKDSLTLCAG